MHQDLVKKGYLGLKWPKSCLNWVFYRIVIAIYVPTYPPIFGIKIGKIVVTYPFPIVPQDKTFVVTLWMIPIPGVLGSYTTFLEKNPYETLDFTNRFPNFVYESGVTKFTRKLHQIPSKKS